MTEDTPNETPPEAPRRRRSPRKAKPLTETAATRTGPTAQEPATSKDKPSSEAAGSQDTAPAGETSTPKPKPAARRRAPRGRIVASAGQGKVSEIQTPLAAGQDAATPKTRRPTATTAKSSSDAPASGSSDPGASGSSDAVAPGSSDPVASTPPTEGDGSGTRPRRRRRGRGGGAAKSAPGAKDPSADSADDKADDKEEAKDPATEPTPSEGEPTRLEGEPGRQEGERGRSTTAKSARRRRKPGTRRREDQPLRPPGPRTMLVSVGADRHQIAILEKRELVEHYVAHNDGRSLVGNVYMGRVQNVLPGMEAAFLDIGEGRNAVLYAGEVAFDEEIEGPAPRIETMLKSGQAVLAQVTKDPIGSKGARLTTEVSIAGRYLVLVPKSDFIGISRRLPDDERKRLKELATKVRPEGAGLIVRTAAEGIAEEDLRRDAARLSRIHQDIESKSKKAKPPKLIHSEPDLAIRVVRDLLTTDVEKVVVDDKDVFEEISRYVTEVTPDLAERLELYEDVLPLFEQYHVVEQVRKAIDRKVWLKSGGHLVIDRSEALTVVDVNTGKFVGRHTLEDTVLQTNLEAAEEVAKQLRLRDIGGIIVIDFIDMIHERNREELLRVLKGALAMDKTRTQVSGGVSDLGLVQMTRKRISEGLLESFSEKCDKCEGRGVILTDLD